MMAFSSSPALAQSRRTSNVKTAPLPAPAAPPRPYTSPPVQAGTFTGNTFTHNQLGFTLTLPDGWQVQNEEVKKAIVDVGKGILNSTPEGKSKLRNIGEKTIQSGLLLLTVRPGTERINPAFGITAENIAVHLSVRTPQQFYARAREFLNAPNAPFQFSDELEIEQIGGMTYGTVEGKPKQEIPFPIRQRLYITIRHNHAILINMLYVSDEQMQQCLEVLRLMKFS